MQEVLKIIIGICVLFLGFPIGNILAKNTKEELADGRKWFLLLIALSFIGAILGLIFENDWLMFTFLFIAMITSRSIIEKKKVVKEKKPKKNKRR